VWSRTTRTSGGVNYTNIGNVGGTNATTENKQTTNKMKYISFSDGTQQLWVNGHLLDTKRASPIYTATIHSTNVVFTRKRNKRRGFLFHSPSEGTYVNRNPKKFTKEAKKQRKTNIFLS
jgi:hypothetical protein